MFHLNNILQLFVCEIACKTAANISQDSFVHGHSFARIYIYIKVTLYATVLWIKIWDKFFKIT